MRMTLAMLWRSADPISTLHQTKWEWLAKIMKTKKGSSFRKRKNDRTVDKKWETSFFLAMGHVDICYQGKVISMVPRPHSGVYWYGWRQCLFRQSGKNTSELCRGKVIRPCLLMVWGFDRPTSSHPALSGTRNEDLLIYAGNQAAVDERKERSSMPALPAKRGSRCDPL